MSVVGYTGKARRTLQRILYLRRKQRKKRKEYRKKKISSHVGKYGKEYSSIIVKYIKGCGERFRKVYTLSTIELDVPKVFCFSRNPDSALEFIQTLAAAITNTSIKQIMFNHTKCEELGVCASTIMDVVLMHGKKWRQSIHEPIVYGGYLTSDNRLSMNLDVDRLLKTSGILKHLNICDIKINQVECLGLIQNGESAHVAADIIDYINRALSRHGLALSELGTNYFGQLLGEIVDNCSQHGGKDAIWYTLGHYNYNNITKEGKCQLVILDFGSTIYEGLKNASIPSIKKKIDRYVAKSWRAFSRPENEETLYTLFSLQQRVSRFDQKNCVRGNGTITFLNAFQKLFNNDDSSRKSMLSITSGHSSILFDGTYCLKETTYSSGYKNSIIAFNKENDLKKPPDPQYVRTLKNSFPGTIISMELYIDDRFIRRKG